MGKWMDKGDEGSAPGPHGASAVMHRDLRQSTNCYNYNDRATTQVQMQVIELHCNAVLCPFFDQVWTTQGGKQVCGCHMAQLFPQYVVSRYAHKTVLEVSHIGQIPSVYWTSKLQAPVNIALENEQHTQSTRISPTFSTTACSFLLATNLSLKPTV